MTFVCVWQIYALFKQLHFCRTQAVALRVSLVSLGMQALWDAVFVLRILLLCGGASIIFYVHDCRVSRTHRVLRH